MQKSLTHSTITTSITPEKNMSILSPSEVRFLLEIDKSELQQLFRRCALAVLSTGSIQDDVKELLKNHADFSIKIIQQSRGIKIALTHAPASAFVDGIIIRGIKEHLFAVLRDIVYLHQQVKDSARLTNSQDITDLVFNILRHANLLSTSADASLVMCWGGHSIGRKEYDYTKEVGYQLGLRQMNIGTGCGPGAMKGPMKGATIAHAKQHYQHSRFIGITEPGIIAAEPPNPIVNELVILPDIEKRLEAFVRTAHGIIVFPGGVGTAEEILYLLGILMHPNNKELPFPLIFTAPETSRAYFEQIDEFIGKTLGAEAQKKYTIIIGNPEEVAITMKESIKKVFEYRKNHKDAYYFNWLLHIDSAFQYPFEPNHENMKKLIIQPDLPSHELAANLRRMFSGLVTGNVKESGIKDIESKGPYQIFGDKNIMQLLDQLLHSFVNQGRMSLSGRSYKPCYELVKNI